jgi:hypothetical protein
VQHSPSPFVQRYKALPPITQFWVTLTVLTSVLSWADPARFGVETLCWDFAGINNLEVPRAPLWQRCECPFLRAASDVTASTLTTLRAVLAANHQRGLL